MRGTTDRHGQLAREASAELSLLWPPGTAPLSPDERRLDAAAGIALDLETVVQAISGGHRRYTPFVKAQLTMLCTDLQVIAYRQEIVADLLANPALCGRLTQTLEDLTALDEALHLSAEWSILTITHRLTELEAYIAVVGQLDQALREAEVHAQGLVALRSHLAAVVATPSFQTLQRDVPTLRATLSQACSVTIGLNLSPDLSPESAAILSISADRVEGRQPLLWYLGGAPGTAEELEPPDAGRGGARARRGLTPLRGVHGRSGSGPASSVPMTGRDFSQQSPLTQDLHKLLERVAAPVARVLQRYLAVQTKALARLGAELFFLLGGVTMLRQLHEAGLPVCRAEPAPLTERVCVLEESYNVSLALQMTASASEQAHLPDRLVTNPVTFDGMRGRVWILTGPNRGGKTTYLRAVGLVQVLFQAGLAIPARTARLSPVDAIHTHFPSQETAQLGAGRLDEEAARLAQIFQTATPHSLVLLNEVLAGTSAIEAFALALDAVRGLRLLGTRALYATHLHELAARVEEINAQTPGDSLVGSLVADAEETTTASGAGHRRTFRIRPGPPRGSSYASEIAVQHGISFAQLAALLRQRGVVT